MIEIEIEVNAENICTQDKKEDSTNGSDDSLGKPDKNKESLSNSA